MTVGSDFIGELLTPFGGPREVNLFCVPVRKDDSASGTVPLAQEPADWPKHHVGRGTVPEDVPSWNAFWHEHGGRG